MAVLGPGAQVGHWAVLTGEPRSATVEALDDGEIWTLTPHEYLGFFGYMKTIKRTVILLLEI